MTDDASRADLAALLEYVQEIVDQLNGDGMTRLAATMLRLSADGSTGPVLDINRLPQTDVNELRELLDDIAEENGLVWELVDGDDK